MAEPNTTELPIFDSLAIANIFLQKARSEARKLDVMQVLKLCYLAHGWHLGFTDRPLFGETVYAWPYGPVVPPVYHAFKHFKASPITELAGEHHLLTDDFIPYEAEPEGVSQQVINSVWGAYRESTGLELSALTHQKDSPWEQVTRGKTPAEIKNIPIPNKVIRDYYSKLLNS